MTICLYSLSNPTAWLDPFRAIWTDVVQMHFQCIHGFPFSGSSAQGDLSSYLLLPLTVAFVTGCYFPSLASQIPLLASSTVFQGCQGTTLLLYPLLLIPFGLTCVAVNQVVAKLFKNLLNNEDRPKWKNALLNGFFPNFLRNFSRVQQIKKNHKIDLMDNETKPFFIETALQARQWVWHIITTTLVLSQSLWHFGFSVTSLYYLGLALFFSLMNLYTHPLLWQNLVDLGYAATKKMPRGASLLQHMGYHLVSGLAQGGAFMLTQTSPLPILAPPMHYMAQLWLFSVTWMHLIACITIPFIYYYTAKKDPFTFGDGELLERKIWTLRPLPNQGRTLLFQEKNTLFQEKDTLFQEKDTLIPKKGRSYFKNKK